MDTCSFSMTGLGLDTLRSVSSSSTGSVRCTFEDPWLLVTVVFFHLFIITSSLSSQQPLGMTRVDRYTCASCHGRHMSLWQAQIAM
jgi:hypothetical protein